MLPELHLVLFPVAVGVLVQIVKQLSGKFWQTHPVGHNLVDLLPYFIGFGLSWIPGIWPADWSRGTIILAALCLSSVAESIYNKWKRRVDPSTPPLHK